MARDRVHVVDVVYEFVKIYGRYPTMGEARELASKYTKRSELRDAIRSDYKRKDLATTPPPGLRDFMGQYLGANVWMLDVPVLSRIAVISTYKHWDDTKVTGAVQATDWWKNRNSAQRSWAQTPEADRQRLMEQTAISMADRWFQIYGTTVDPDKFLQGGAARRVASGNLTMEQWESNQKSRASEIPETPWYRQIRSEDEAQRQRQVDIENLGGQLQQRANNQFLLPVAEDQMQGWAKAIAENRASEDDFNDWARKQAAGLFTGYASQIEQGVDPQTLFGSYRDLASRELERDVGWRDPVMWNAITNPAGTPTLSQFQQQIRSSDAWRKTSGARDMADSLVSDLGRIFGRTAF